MSEDRFADVHPILRENLLNIPKIFRNHIDRNIFASAEVWKHYVPSISFDRSDLRNWKNSDRSGEIARYRLNCIGSALFDLRSQPIFDQMVSRISERTLDAVHHELSAAILFANEGFMVLPNPNSGKKGDDFDFGVGIDSICFPVEVSEVRTKKYSDAAIANKLKKKARQLPRTNLGIVILFLPMHWKIHETELAEQIDKTIDRFLKKSSRVVMVYTNSEREYSLINNILSISAMTKLHVLSDLPIETVLYLQPFFKRLSADKRISQAFENENVIDINRMKNLSSYMELLHGPVTNFTPLTGIDC